MTVDIRRYATARIHSDKQCPGPDSCSQVTQELTLPASDLNHRSARRASSHHGSIDHVFHVAPKRGRMALLVLVFLVINRERWIECRIEAEVTIMAKRELDTP
jgi:hypothetical protein